MKKIAKSNNKILVIIIAGIVLVGGGIASFTYFKHKTDSEKSIYGDPYGPSTEDQKKSGSDSKKEFLDKHTENSSNSPGQEAPPQSTPAKQSIPITITSNQKGTDGVFRVRTIIQTTETNGVCKLTLQGSTGQVISKESTLIRQTTYASCAGFDVESVPQGDWVLTIEFETANYIGKISKDVSI